MQRVAVGVLVQPPGAGGGEPVVAGRDGEPHEVVGGEPLDLEQAPLRRVEDPFPSLVELQGGSVRRRSRRVPGGLVHDQEHDLGVAQAPGRQAERGHRLPVAAVRVVDDHDQRVRGGELRREGLSDEGRLGLARQRPGERRGRQLLGDLFQHPPRVGERVLVAEGADDPHAGHGTQEALDQLGLAHPRRPPDTHDPRVTASGLTPRLPEEVEFPLPADEQRRGSAVQRSAPFFAIPMFLTAIMGQESAYRHGFHLKILHETDPNEFHISRTPSGFSRPRNAPDADRDRPDTRKTRPRGSRRPPPPGVLWSPCGFSRNGTDPLTPTRAAVHECDRRRRGRGH